MKNNSVKIENNDHGREWNYMTIVIVILHCDKWLLVLMHTVFSTYPYEYDKVSFTHSKDNTSRIAEIV